MCTLNVHIHDVGEQVLNVPLCTLKITSRFHIHVHIDCAGYILADFMCVVWDKGSTQKFIIRTNELCWLYNSEDFI